MDTELKIITLPNGAKAYIKPNISRKDYNELLRVVWDATKVNPKTQDMADVPLSVQLEMNEKALGILLVKVVLSDGTVATNPVDTVGNMNKEDTDVLYDEIDAITTAVFNAKKN